MNDDFSDFKLGGALVRVRSRTIEVGGEARQIDHKALRVLICLARRAGTVVAKQEIFAEVWAQAFVSDDVLTVAISRLRRALGDEARAPRFIETVPSVGYRLIAPFEPVEPRSRWLPAAIAPATIAPATIVLAVGLLSVALFAFVLTRRPAEEPVVTTTRSLAVLPLENLTGDPDQAYVAAGMTEALITGLARREGLRVVSRASVRRYEARRPSLDEIARELDVDTLVEGSVQRSGDQLRVSARLIDVGGDRHLWAGSFDGDLREVLELQERAVAAMTRALGFGANLRASIRPTMPASPAAYEGYLRARYLLGQPPSRQRLSEAVGELERAIAVEGDFVAAHVALAEAFLILGEEALLPPREAFAQVRGAAERALALSEGATKPEALLAMVEFLHDWDFTTAEKRFKRALVIDPNNILARDGYSRLLTVTGRFDEALDQQRTLRELNPLIYHQPYLAYIHNMARRHDLALKELQRQLALEQRSPRLYSHLASTYRWLGRPAEAIVPFLTSLSLSGAPPGRLESLRAAFDRDSVAGVGRFIARHYEQVQIDGSIPAMSRAEAFVLAGEPDAAIRRIKQAFDEREPGLLVIVRSPDYDVLREKPEFQDVLRRLGLSPEDGDPAPEVE